MHVIYKKLNLGSAKPYFDRTVSAFRRVEELTSRRIESYVERRVNPETEWKFALYSAPTFPLTAIAVSIVTNSGIIGIIAGILQMLGVGTIADHALKRIYPMPMMADIPYYTTNEVYKL